MAKTKVDIEVELTGLQKVEKSIKGVEGGLEGVGETGAKLVQSMGITNEKLGEGLENLSGSVGETREAFTQLGGSLKNLGTSGMSGILGLIGPLGMLVSAGILLYETFRQISGAAQEAEEAQEAMAAAAGDLQSRFESLAEAGVILARKEMVAFSESVLEAQFLKEKVQKKQEKFYKNFDRIRKSIEKVDKATEHLSFVQRVYRKDSEILKDATNQLRIAEEELRFGRKNAEIGIEKLNDLTLRYLHSVERLQEKEDAARKQSTESLKADAKKLAGLQAEAVAIHDRTQAKGDEIALAQVEYDQKVKALKLEKELEDATRSQTIAILKRFQTLGDINAVEVETMKLRQRQIEIVKKEGEAEKQAQKERSRRYKERLKQREQLFRKEVALQTRIQQIEIKMEKSGSDQAFALESVQHEATLKLIKKNSLEEQLEEKRHELALRTISERAIKEDDADREIELQKIQENNLKRVELEYTLAQKILEAKTQGQGFGTELERIQFESQKELDLLKLQYDTEIEMARIKGEEIASIEKRFALDSLIITKRTTQEQAAILSDYFAEYSEGFAQAGFNALFFGESFQEATSQILKSLAQQAVSQSVMKAAEGFGLLAMGLPGAALAFKSSALFATAASVAGVASNALGGGGAAQTGASPSGQPSTAPTPEREQVTNDSMVFNINFGGAVVYDTKKAAEQALADRLVSIINTPRRGAVQFNRR